MGRRIVIIQGHPDSEKPHLCHALADAYAEGASQAGCKVVRFSVASLNFPFLRTREDFESGSVPDALRPVQEAIAEADHLLIIYPLWLGGMPAIVKAFLEQTLRPGFAYAITQQGWRRKLAGKSARVVVTMGMPVFFYRLYFGAHGLKHLKQSILRFCGMSPVRDTLFGMVQAANESKRRKWLATMRRLGTRAV